MALEESDLDTEITQVMRALSGSEQSYGVSAEAVERTVRDCVAAFKDARIKEFVGLFAERAARARLRGMASAASDLR